MYVCLCKGLTEADVQRVVQDGQLELQGLITALNLDDDDCCGRCARNITELIGISCGNGSCSSSKSSNAGNSAKRNAIRVERTSIEAV